MLKISTKPVTFIPTFEDNHKEDQPLSFTVGRLKYNDFWEIAVLIDRFQKAVTSDAGPDKSKAIIELANEFRPFFESYVQNIQNFEVDDKPGTIGDILNSPGLSALVMEIAVKLLEISQPSDKDKKKSTEPSATPSIAAGEDTSITTPPSSSNSSRTATDGFQLIQK